MSITNLWPLETPAVSIINLWLIVTPMVSIECLRPFNATEFLMAISLVLKYVGKIPINIGTTICNTEHMHVIWCYTRDHTLTLTFNACDTHVRCISHVFNVELYAGLYHTKRFEY